MKKDPKKNYSISKKLKLENKINEDFEVRLSNLTLEYIIAHIFKTLQEMQLLSLP